MPQPGYPGFWTSSPVVGRRDLRIDLLRGFAVLAMVVDHVGGASPLYALTGGNRFFVSAAEGFVFISGLLVGIVYGDELRGRGWRAATLKALRRAFTLYALTVWLAIGFAAFSAVLGLPWAPDPGTTSFGQFVLRTATFRRAYYLVDVMQLYTLLLLATPLALWLLGRGKARALLGLSLALWLAGQLSGGRLQIPWTIEENVVFNFVPWQVLFFAAMTLGFERKALSRHQIWAVRLLPGWVPGGWLGVSAVGVGVLIWLHVTNGAALGLAGLSGEPAAALDAWFDKASLPPLRLVACAVVFAFIWNLVSATWPLIRAAFGWLLLPLGSRALYAYASHVFVAGVAYVGMGLFEGWRRPAPWSNLAAQVIAVAAVWLAVHWEYPRRLFGWMGSPPLVRPGCGGQVAARFPLPTSSLLVIAAVCLLGVTALDARWPDVAPALTTETTYASRRTAPEPRFEVTVTARRIADLASRSGDQMPERTSRASAPAGHDRSPDPARTLPVRSLLADRSFYSATLKRTMPYGVYLPPGYSPDCSRRYPVVYLLHGGPTNYTEWPQMGIRDVEDRLIAVGDSQPMVLVFAEGEGSYFFNHQGGPAWGDYIARDLVNQVDRSVCTIPQRESRVIAGLSAGGHGALQLAFNYPGVFGIVGAHGPALPKYEDRGSFFGTAEYFKRFDPLTLAETADTAPLAIWLDAGEADPGVRRAEQLHRILFERGWRSRLAIYRGGHDTQYWTNHLSDYLRFYSAALAGKNVGASAGRLTGPTR